MINHEFKDGTLTRKITVNPGISLVLILLGPPGALTFAAIATLFHVGIAATMGLNRFVFAFGAALPSTYWISAPLHDLATSSLSTLLHITSPVLGL